MNSEIVDLTLVTCFEGGSNYWIAHTSSYVLPLTITDIEGDQHALTFADFHAGWEIIEAQFPDSAARLAALDGQADADDTDILLQLVVFGDIIYG